MNMFKTGGLIAVAALAILVYSSIFTVDERESALVIRFGEIQRTIEEPGLYFKLPLFEELRKVELRMMFMQSTDKAVQVVDGRRYSVDAITMVRIEDPQKFRETVDASWCSPATASRPVSTRRCARPTAAAASARPCRTIARP
jgi:modulator of FtsH protease HflC